jgi:hypothetical protein
MAIATGTAKPIGPARLLQGSLTSRLSAIEPLELRQGETFLELGAAARHERANIYVLLYGPRAATAK